MTTADKLRRWCSACTESLGVFIRDIGHGVLEVSHNTLALLGLAVVAVGVFAAGRPDLVDQAERQAFSWLQQRHDAREAALATPEDNALIAFSEPDAVARATATDPRALPRQQALLATWIARRYRVAPEPVSRLVKEAYEVGHAASLEPTLILAIMAIESSFNPFAQSPVGAQGLMQVMTHIHDGKYEAFGGTHAAFDPVSNVRVGVQVLKECIARAGSLEGGLRFYVGAANLESDGGYAFKVLAEQDLLKSVLNGKQVAFNQPLPAAPAPLPASALVPVSLATGASAPLPSGQAASGTPAGGPAQPAPALPPSRLPGDEQLALR